MKKSVSITIWLTNPGEYIKGGAPRVTTAQEDLDMTTAGWVVLDSQQKEVEFEVPSIETMTTRTVSSLKDLIQKTRAEAQVKVQELEKQINNILSIEMSPRNSDDIIDDDIPF